MISTNNLDSIFNEGLKGLQSYGRGDFGERLLKEKQNSWGRLQESGLPTTKKESWKYTDLSTLSKKEFAPAPAIEMDVLESDPKILRGFSLDAYRLVFANGVYIPGLSHLPVVTGVSVTAFSEVIMGMNSDQIENFKKVEDTYYIKHGEASMDDLNSSLTEDGYWIRVAKNQKLDKPLHVLHLCAGESSKAWTQSPKSVVVLETGSELELVESCIGSGDHGQGYFQNVFTTIELGANARLKYSKLVDEFESGHHFGSVKCNMQRDSFFEATSVSLGGELIRNDIQVDILGEGAEAHVNGLYLTKGSQHVDNHTEIRHAKPNGLSRQLYKGILDDQSRAVFNGKITIDQEAQRTDSSQLNQNLLLSSKAEIDSKPELEVSADDVKANHGSASGPLDKSEVFYFNSRAISEDEATKMIARGFAMDVLYKQTAEDSRKYLIQFVDQIDWNV